MSFTSIKFIFIFLPIVLSCYIYINKKHPNFEVYFLLLVSLFYCAYIDIIAASILCFSIFANYSIALIIRRLGKKSHRKVLVTSGICANVFLLFAFKFSLENSLGVLHNTVKHQSVFLEIGIPLGLSFYTFYQISFLVDTYKSETKFLDFFKYSLSVSLFSQLTAGPILNYRDGFSQFDQIGKKPFNYENLSRGISLFTVGLLKKVLLADSLATITSQLHHAISMGKELNSLESIGATWGFLLQLYFDFSAYSDMALGLGLCFGFTFPINFNSPLKATSFSDFISKWHMSLINFTRNYIFLPISKYVKKKAKGKAVKRQFIGWAVGLQASFLVINIWHSPTLMLVLQGLVLGLFLIIVNVIGKSISRISITPKKTSIRIKRLKAVLGHFLVLSAASIFATFLRISNFNELSTLFHGFFRLPKLETDNTLLIETTSHFAYLISDRLVPSIQEPITLLGYQTLTIPTIPFLLLLTLIGIFGPNTMQAFGMVVHLEKKWYQNFLWRPSLKWGIFIGLALASYLMIAENTSSLKFLYE